MASYELRCLDQSIGEDEVKLITYECESIESAKSSVKMMIESRMVLHRASSGSLLQMNDSVSSDGKFLYYNSVSSYNFPGSKPMTASRRYFVIDVEKDERLKIDWSDVIDELNHVEDFKEDTVDMGKQNGKQQLELKEKSTDNVATPSGGDASNLFMFYVGGSYQNNSYDNIAAYGKEHVDCLKDKTIEEIKNAHMYWGSDEASGYDLKGMYNGDTVVLFGDLEKLPAQYKADALKMCDKYRNTKQKAVEVFSEASAGKGIAISHISRAGLKEASTDDGKKFYIVGLRVSKDVSSDGFAQFTCTEKNIINEGKTVKIAFSADHERSVRIRNAEGERETIKMKVSELSDAHEKGLEEAKTKDTSKAAEGHKSALEIKQSLQQPTEIEELRAKLDRLKADTKTDVFDKSIFGMKNGNIRNEAAASEFASIGEDKSSDAIKEVE